MPSAPPGRWGARLGPLPDGELAAASKAPLPPVDGAGSSSGRSDDADRRSSPDRLRLCLAPAARALAGPERRRRLLPLMLAVSLLMPAAPVRAVSTDQLERLLQRGSCPGCRLQEADLIHADLRDSDLRRAQLQRANLSRARLDAARLGGADLSFTSLLGASLRGADLRGARLEGTDLRDSDLSGARLDPGALSRSHWSQARGIPPGVLTHVDLHNGGVEAWQSGDTPRADALFADAIALRPDTAISWLARAIVRGELGRDAEAALDFRQAAEIYARQGQDDTAARIRGAATALEKPRDRARSAGNGVGGSLLDGALNVLQSLALLAAQLIPVGI